MPRQRCGGFTLVESLVALTLLVLVLSGLAGLLIQNARVNKSQRMSAEIQNNARNCLSLIVQRLRSAGWDPAEAGIPVVTLDPDPADDVSQIEVFADLDADGTTTGDNEQVLIRHVDDRIEWRSSPSSAFATLAVGVTNDADGDGNTEPMFTSIPDPNPVRIRVQITTRSPSPDPTTGEFRRFTVRSDVLLRKVL